MSSFRHQTRDRIRCGHLPVMLLVAIAWIAPSVFAQQGGTTRYVYDDNGRLHAVIAPNGEANVYEYDAAGNFTAIRRNAATTLEVLDFSPRVGVPGTQVTLVGTGFGGGVNSVSFNGTAAQVVSVNAPVVVVTVPNGATTGPISVTTVGGASTTARPFTVKGISVTPDTADVLSQRYVQFTASVLAEGDQTVVWSVDSLAGGSSTVGTISQAGLYFSPNLPANQPLTMLRIRATSVSDPAVFGEAVVTVRNHEFFRAYYTNVISVLNGGPAQVHSTPLSVLNGERSQVHSVPLSVLNGEQSQVFTASLSVLNGEQSQVFSVPLAVLNGDTGMLHSPFVAVTKGPAITGLTPAQAVRGVTTAITFAGANLSGATELTFVDAVTGAVATGITAANITVNGAGTALTANVTVSSGVTLGRYTVFVTTPTATSPPGDAGTNVLEVIP